MPPKKTVTVQAFEVDSSFIKTQKHCETTHKKFSQFISHQFGELLRKGESKWLVSLDQFSNLITKDSKDTPCRFRLSVEVNKRVDDLASATSIQKGILLSCLLYQVAMQLEQGQKKQVVKRIEEKA